MDERRMDIEESDWAVHMEHQLNVQKILENIEESDWAVDMEHQLNDQKILENIEG